MPERFVIATQNPGKIREFQALLKDIEGELILPGEMEDIEETGTTFEENARIKAKAVAEKFQGMVAIADDSGLVVDALDGRPGVYSKRYGENDADRIQKLLAELKNISNRKAKFVCVICVYGNGIDECFTGDIAGMIGEPKGSKGFGYDPIFIPEGYTQTFAELGNEVKNTISHRSRAMEKAKDFLKKLTQ